MERTEKERRTELAKRLAEEREREKLAAKIDAKITDGAPPNTIDESDDRFFRHQVKQTDTLTGLAMYYKVMRWLL